MIKRLLCLAMAILLITGILPLPTLAEALVIQATDFTLDAADYLEAFPDVNFRAEVLKFLNTDNGGRTDLSPITDPDKARMASATQVSFPRAKDIADLTGIEYFTGMTDLWCDNNRLTELDVSNSPNLSTVNCYNNQLTKLKANTGIRYIHCYNNLLETLDLSAYDRLLQLYCYNNKLKTLAFPAGSMTTLVHCYNNQLTSIDLSNAANLVILYCQNNDFDIWRI